MTTNICSQIMYEDQISAIQWFSVPSKLAMIMQRKKKMLIFFSLKLFIIHVTSFYNCQEKYALCTV